MQDYGGNNQPCGETVTAHCRCPESASQKVYDESTGKFHCKPSPPTAPCSKWDNAFSYDPAVWECATRPFNGDPKDAAKRLKNCIGGGMLDKHWGKIENLLIYDTSIPAMGQVRCSMVNGKPVTSAIAINPNGLNYAASPNYRPGTSPWQWLADTLIHAAYHFDDFGRNNYCWDLWTRFSYATELRRNRFSADYNGMEAYTNDRTFKDYHNQLGVRAPEDPKYNPAQHGTLLCPLEL